ncbi:hypothetical protein [Frigoribacterium sp. PhB24]|uniref:hypothetical protein n=1 Tax=Frigoribacterium sp. PhB24 TaxID=2485204 RepID=UPI000F49096F|nr:hypothetical protein [Frigoribacterium sp. PhB24]ROS47921.1 hypothetical protein EDF50_3263 [Frigoribacterium sp. PhB24]
MAETTTSTAVLAGEDWTVTNPDHEVVTRGLWLDETLTCHRSELAARTGATVELRYVVNGVDVDLDVQKIRRVMHWLHETYRASKRLEKETRPDRDALLKQLSVHRVMPSEMALMAGVDLSIAERFAGDDAEARIARQLLHKLSPPGSGSDTYLS